MAAKPETKITQACIHYLKSKGGDAWHVHGSMFQRSGEPDIDGWVRWGERIFHVKIEVKTASGIPSELQLARLRVYHRAGYVAGVVTSPEELMDLLYKHGNYLKLSKTARMAGFGPYFGIDKYQIYGENEWKPS